MKWFKCYNCGCSAQKSTGHYNRSIKTGAKLFCSKKCSDTFRKKDIPIAIKKLNKRLYDMEYRAKNRAMIKKKKAAYFQKSNAENPERYKAQRQKRMPKHVEYCRQPKYKEKKHTYDRKRYAKDKFGDLWEIHVLAMDITEEAQRRMSKFEMMQKKGTINKAQRRKRKWKSLMQSA